MSMRKIIILVCVVAVSAASAISNCADWPQWRGPKRDGVVDSFAPPMVWPEKLRQIWKVTVGSGHSSPSVVGEKIFVHTRINEQEVVSEIDLNSGKQLWQDRYPCPYTMNPAAVAHGKGPKSTPALFNGKLYALGISGILSCYDASKGKLLWRKEFSKTFKETSPLFGVSMSPIVDAGLLVVHVGGHDEGALTAFDAERGEVKWSWRGDGPGHSSPIVVDLEGTRQIVTQTQKFLVGVDIHDGRLLWSIPFTTEYDQNIVTPLLYKQTIVYSGFAKGTTAIKLVKRENRWRIDKAWENPEISMYMNSPVAGGDLLFGFAHRNKGQFFCLDARTGLTLWTSPGRQGENASIVQAGDLLLLLTNDAELIIAKATAKGFEPVRRYSVAQSPTWAHPILIGHRILIKDADTLSLWSVD